MKYFLIVLIAAIGILPVAALAAKKEPIEPIEVREERSVNAFNVFRQICFANYKDAKARVQFAVENYTPIEGDKKKEVLDFVQSTGGYVWGVAVPPYATYMIVTEDNGNCHVITQKSGEEKLHREMKNLVFSIRDSLTFSVVDYKGINPENPVHTARIDVKDPDGSIYFTVFTVTKENKETESAEGVISLIPPAKQ